MTTRQRSAFAVVIAFIFLIGGVRAEHNAKLSIRIGHADEITSLAFTPDGKYVISSSLDNTVKVWDTASEILLHTLEGHSADVLCVAISPDGRFLASASGDRQIKVWNIPSGKEVGRLEGHDFPVDLVVFSPDSRLLASRGLNGETRIWDWTSGQLLRLLEGNIEGVIVFSPDGKSLVGGRDDRILFWDVYSGKVIHTIKGHTGKVVSVGFSPDGNWLASASLDRTIRVWSMPSGELDRIIEDDSIKIIGFMKQSEKLVSGGADQTIRIWNLQLGKLERSLGAYARPLDPSLPVALSADGGTIATSSPSHSVKLWDVSSGELLHTLQGHASDVFSIAYSRDGHYLVSGSNDQAVRVWNLRTGSLDNVLKGHTESVLSVAISGDGQRIASASGDHSVKIWDLVSGELVHDLEGHKEFSNVVAFSPDGKKLASGGGDGAAKIWDAASGALLVNISDRRGEVDLAFSPDGTEVVTSSSLEVPTSIWDVDSGGLVIDLQPGPNTAVAFSPDGETLAVADSEIVLWNVRSEEIIRKLSGHDKRIKMVAFSPSGYTIASVDPGVVKIWDAVSGRLLRDVRGCTGDIHSAAFSPDGTVIALGCMDASIRFRSVYTGELLGTAYTFGLADYIIFTPEGYFVSSRGAEAYISWIVDGEVHLFNQYSEVFRRSDLVVRRLSGFSVNAPKISESDERPPELTWANQFVSTKDARPTIRLSYRGKSRLKNLFVFFNNEELEIDANAAMVNYGELTFPLTLKYRRNHLLIAAFDEGGQRSKPLKIDFEFSRSSLESEPRISFKDQASGGHTFSSDHVLKFQVDSTSEIDTLQLLQNDKPLVVSPSGKTSEGEGYSVFYEVPVKLALDANHFKVIATMSDGVSSQEVISIIRDPVSRLWIVAIGVNEYSDPAIPDLQFAVADAQGVYDYYRVTFGLEPDRLFLLVNEEADLKSIKALLGTHLSREVDRRDTVIIYFAGHGMKEDDSSSADGDGFARYLLPNDARPADLFSTSLGMDDITDRILRRIPAERVILIIDSCFSGAGGGRTRRSIEARLSSSEFLDRIAKTGRGQIVLTAGDADQFAREDEVLKHGVFTYYLLEGLKGAADEVVDHVIDIQELYSYVSEKVRAATGNRQNPILRAPELEGKVVVGFSKN
jgi:WD40 repeat protein